MITANYLKLTEEGLKYLDWDSKKHKHCVCDVTRNIKPYLFFDCHFDDTTTLYDILNLIYINTHVFSTIFNYDTEMPFLFREDNPYPNKIITFAWDVVWVPDSDFEIRPVLFDESGEYLTYDKIEDIINCPVILNTDFIIRKMNMKEISGKKVEYSHYGGLQFPLFDIVRLVIEEFKN
jgi:hypothetical protein